MLGLILLLPVTLLGAQRDQSAHAARLRNVTKTSTVAQGDQNNPQAEDVRITSVDNPFTFKKVGKIRTITNITITVTLLDADTAPGEQDEGALTLALDGIDTGLVLDGFGNQADVTRTITGVPISAAQLRSALKTDRKLAATIIEADPTDDNGVTVRSEFDATFVLKGKQTR